MRLETERLILRPWEDRDRPALAAVIGDPEVRRFYPRVGSRRDADEMIDRAIAKTAEHGFHFQAAELKEDGAFVGIIGLARFIEETRAAIPGRPEVEIGWQFDKRFWGRGLAPEGARAWLAHAWDVLDLPEVAAITAAVNRPSQRVMEKIGMRRDPGGDFEHPAVPEGSPLRPHVLYRIGNPRR